MLRLLLALLVLLALLASANAFSRSATRIKLASGTRAPSSATKLNLFGSPEPPKNQPAKKDGGGGGLFGMGGGMMDKMKQAQEMMKKAEEINKELMDTAVIGQDKEGQVFATFNGMAMPVGIKIPDSVLAQGSEAASLAATQAIIDAHTKAQGVMMGKMQAMYGGLPGMPKP